MLREYFKIGMFALLVGVILMDLNSIACHDSSQHHHHHQEEAGGMQVDKEHISEHLDEEAKLDYNNMTGDELRFYYFKLHDLNNDTKLDGLEIFKAMHHSYGSILEENAKEYLEKHHHGETLSSNEMHKLRSNIDSKYLSGVIDLVLNESDSNNDGYVNYMEFTKYYQRDE